MAQPGRWKEDMEQAPHSQAFSRAARLFALMRRRPLITDVVQGIIAGAVLAFITATFLINAEVHAKQTTVNGWSITPLWAAAHKRIYAESSIMRSRRRESRSRRRY
jgi:hypothetical protein